MEQKVDTKNLALGMFVSRLDRPWLDTPFLLQGFIIKNKRDLGLLQKYCDYVYVKKQGNGEARIPEPGVILDRRVTADRRKGARGRRATDGNIPKRKKTYSVTVSTTQEIDTARSIVEDASVSIHEMMDDVRARKAINVPQIRAMIKDVSDSIIRNPDAFMLLRQMQKKDNYTYEHSLSTAILAMAFARHLGMPKEEIEISGLGALLFDIGKLRIPSELLAKPARLSEREFETVKKHVDCSVEILQETAGVSGYVSDIAATHHERFDGKGYPRQLNGGEIPILGRMAAIVDCYDAITSERAYASAISPHEALRLLYEWRGTSFQAELVEQFIQSLGVYPTGTLVALNTQEVGIVIAQNPVRRLRPTIMLILDAEKKPIASSPVINLQTDETENGECAREIVTALDPHAHGIDPQNYYL